ncbi:MAG: SDR family oxidoreductase [Christensenellaceae bacterium]|jgi:3-oxoacyl-[acyl-carrier protein] reductase|nr:SDR family oxidoreductase [Christensenellaceae bacterium]
MIAVISGGATGIGRKCAEKFKKEGYTVYALYFMSVDAAAQLTGIKTLKCDVRCYSDCKTAISAVLDAEGKIDVLVNNAGVDLWGLLTDYTQEQIAEVINTNLIGTINLTKAAVPSMVNAKNGSIVNISSFQGAGGASCESVYSATKGAINAFTKSIAKEFGPSNITVNAAAPGLINTKMNAHLSETDISEVISQTPLTRIGTPDDVADAVYFLATHPFITGQILNVDGGLSL